MQSGSKASGNRALRISFKELQWIDPYTAELLVGTSNGIDGSIVRCRVVYKNGTWVIETTKIEAIS